MYITLKYGKEFIEDTFSRTKQKGKANVFGDFLCSYSITLICNVNKILLRDTNLLQLQCKVIDTLIDFFRIVAERLCNTFYHREVCLVSTNVIEDNCSFQGFFIFVRINISFKFDTRIHLTVCADLLGRRRRMVRHV